MGATQKVGLKMEYSQRRQLMDAQEPATVVQGWVLTSLRENDGYNEDELTFVQNDPLCQQSCYGAAMQARALERQNKPKRVLVVEFVKPASKQKKSMFGD